MKKICRICNSEFEAKGTRSVCYSDHYHPCPICGKDVLCNDPNRQDSTCSRKCGAIKANQSREATMLATYGVKNPSELDTVRSKISAKLKEAKPSQPIQYKSCEVCGNSFELHWPYTQHTCSPKCRGEYRKRSGIAKQVYEKSCITNQFRYGVTNQGQRPEAHIKMEDTMEARYGVRYARYLPEIEEKVKQTCMDKYGVPYYIQTEQANQFNRGRISKINKLFGSVLLENSIEFEFEKYVDSKFFDIFIPNQSIVIEINPSYSHSCIGNHWNQDGLALDYHLSKSKLSEENGYRCIHVWDWDDWNAIISLVKPKEAVYARKCTVDKVDKQTADKFTAEHHISGKCNGQKENYGLYYKGELIQVMTFGKPRYNKKYDWELLRLCSKSNVKVLGGASRLFAAYLVEHEDESVISYCDLSKFNGSVYETIGMELSHVTSPAKIWSKGNKKVTDNLLRQRGYDQLFGTCYGKGTSNEQLMLDNGWLPVYDCGQKVYHYIPEYNLK